MPEYIPKIMKGGVEITAPSLLAKLIQTNNVVNEQEIIRQNQETSRQNQLTDIPSINQFPVIAPEADDTGRLQRAINYAQDNKGILIIPSGYTYTFSSKLTIKKSIRILGQKGRAMDKSSLLKFTGTGTAIECLALDGSSNPTMLWGVYMEGITIFRDFTGNYGTVGTGIRMFKNSEFYFHDVQISGFKVAVDMTESNIVTFDHCYFNYNTYGLWLANKNVDLSVYSVSGNNNVNVVDCNFWSQKEAHVVMNNCDNLHFDKNHMEMAPICFLIDTQYGGDTATFLRNIAITHTNYRAGKIDLTTYDQPRFIKFTGSLVVSASNFIIDDAQIMFLASTYSADAGTLPTYAIEGDLPNASSVVQLTIRNIICFGVTSYFVTGSNTKFDINFQDSIIVKSAVDGSGSAIPLYNTSVFVAKGLIRNGKTLQFLNTLKLSDETTGAPTANDLWISFGYPKFNNGTSSLYLQYANSGATGSRPTNSVPNGWLYFDTTLGKPIWKNGSGWVDATGATV